MFLALFTSPFILQGFVPPPVKNTPKKIEIKGFELNATAYEVEVNGTIEEVWKALADEYINVDQISIGIVESGPVDDHPTTGNGAVRYCDINFKGKELNIKEKIVDWKVDETNKEFMYDVYEWKNYPLKKMYQVWGVREANGKVYVYNKIYYKMKNGFLNMMSGGLMKKLAKDGVTMVKHYVETGEGNVDQKVLRKKYREA